MIERNLDTAESRAFWKSVDEGAAEIRKWPLRKRAQVYWSMHCPMCHNNMLHRTGEACCGHWGRPLPDWMTESGNE